MMKMTNRTAILGGSFNPIHSGHLHLIHSVVSHGGFGRIIVIPVNINNFKQDARRESSDDRLNMIDLALTDYRSIYPSDECELLCDDCEIRRGGISYSVDTAAYIKEKYHISDRVGFIMGDDLPRELYRWHGYERLKDLCEFIICRRDDERIEINAPGAVYQIIDNAPMVLSSTRIREMIGEGRDIEGLLPEGVREYVEEHGLYSDR